MKFRKKPLCKGSGKRDAYSFVDPSKTIQRPCHFCHGTGTLSPNVEDLERQLLSACSKNKLLKESHAALMDVVRGFCEVDSYIYKFIRGEGYVEAFSKDQMNNAERALANAKKIAEGL